MQKNSNRKDRVAEMIQRKLAQLVIQEVRDPRMPHFVTIAGVKVTSDLAHAKVYFTALTEDKAQVEAILNAASSFLRSALAKTVELRTVPQLHFVYDESIEYGKKLSRLIDEVNPQDTDAESEQNHEEN